MLDHVGFAVSNAEHSRRFKKPFDRAPRAVDLIRTERDAR